MEARPGSFRYQSEAGATDCAVQLRYSVPYNRVTFIKAVAVNLPQTGRWSLQAYFDDVVVVSRSAIESSTMMLNGFISTTLIVASGWILSNAHQRNHVLTFAGLIVAVSLLFAAVIPCFFTLVMRHDRRLVAELIESNGSTEIYIEPCDDEALQLFVRSLIDALHRLHNSAASLPNDQVAPSV
jgi:hypothetical protein